MYKNRIQASYSMSRPPHPGGFSPGLNQKRLTPFKKVVRLFRCDPENWRRRPKRACQGADGGVRRKCAPSLTSWSTLSVVPVASFSHIIVLVAS